MTEAYGFYWQQNGTSENQIPEVCRETCEKLWETAMKTQPAEIDIFHDCDSFNLSYDDLSLQGGPDSDERFVSILTFCDEHSEDAFSESYTFRCLTCKALQ